jgi:hypothetical protein
VFSAVATGVTQEQSDAGRGNTHLPICRQCGGEFEQIKVNQVFCSPHCKNLFHEVPRALSVIRRHLVTVNEAAALTHRKPWQIRYAISKNKLESVRLPNGAVMLRRSDLLPGDGSPASA